MRSFKVISRNCLLILTVVVCSATILSAQTPAREYQVKAVFLFNFTQFVEWPASSFTSADAPIVIGILGTDPFGSYLSEVINAEKINGHPLILKRYNDADEIKTCHLLFINLPKINEQDKMLARLKEKNILTVSDAAGFLEHGGMIRFYTNNNKIQFRINLESAKGANLVISSKLLRLAEIFKPGKND